MDRKKISGLLIGLLLFSGTASALECDVKFRAKRIKSIEKWYGKVEEPEFKSGIAAGVGSGKQACIQDALAAIKAEGWAITYSEIIRAE